MPRVLNLDTGKFEDVEETSEIESAPAANVDSPADTILDLDTGKMMPIAAPEMQQAPPVQQSPQADVSDFRPVPKVDEDESAFARSAEQGALNIGGGILRGIGELSNILGVEGAGKFLQDLEISQNIEQQKTAQITEGEPVKSFLGETIGETLSFPLGGGGGSLLTRLLSGAAAGGTAGGLSAAGRGEEGSDVAFEAGLGAVLDPVFQGLGAVRNFIKLNRQAGELSGVTPEIEAIETAAANLETAMKAQSETGIRTLPAQKTLDPFQLETQSFIGQNPEASTRAFNVLKEQNREAATAVNSLLDTIATPASPGTAPGQARTAANNIVSSVGLMRSEAASPIYKQAFRRQRRGKSPLIDTAQLELKASKMADQFDESGQVSKNIRIVLEKVSNAKGDLSRLHNAKLEIDQIIEARGDNSIGNTTKRFLTDLQTDLVDVMTEQSPSYRAARDEFRRLSPLVDEVRAGVFGRVADIQDKDLKRVSGILFDASETNPQVAANAIKALKNVEGGNEIASGLLRTEIEKRLGRMKSELTDLSVTGGRKVENVPANLLNNLFGNAKQKKILMDSLKELNPAAFENAKWLEESLTRASSGRPGGSQTGIRNVITQKLRGVTMGIRDFFRKPIDSLVGIGEEADFSRRAAALGEALYNPDWAPDMKKVRKLNPNSEAAKSQFEKLLTKVVDTNEALGVSTQALTTSARVSARDEEKE